MKKLNIVATALSTVAIAGSVLCANSVEACLLKKIHGSTSEKSLISPNSWLSKKLPNRSDFAIAGIAAASLGLTGLGAFFTTRYITRKAEANIDASDESKEVPAEQTFVQQHPEAPGGQLDLVEDNLVDNIESKVVADKEISLLK
ncbi:hypothetical protein Tery_0322 [Trichodesmium erythraeum IMS101]|uniref:Early transcribed membrane protein n=1 Tax=Trichodesmium erythraeum (strain IMS101) TaxID=203124 RepID=Q119M7_TRIEI|nr:hypothetical protein [Trichodesmium erythraeum GBRTRLIN201]